jgi:hypothetical protein
MQVVVINGIEYVPLVKPENTKSLESYYENLLITKHFKSCLQSI